jgi:hypothetical protein
VEASVKMDSSTSTEAIYNQREAEKVALQFARERGGGWRAEKVGNKYRVYQNYTPEEVKAMAARRSAMFDPGYDPYKNRSDSSHSTPVTIGGRPSTEAVYNQREADRAQAELARERGGGWAVEKVGSKFRVYQRFTPQEIKEKDARVNKMFDPDYDPMKNRLDGVRLDACAAALDDISRRLDSHERSRRDSGPEWHITFRNSEGQESRETIAANTPKDAERKGRDMAKQADPGGKWKIIQVSPANSEARSQRTTEERSRRDSDEEKFRTAQNVWNNIIRDTIELRDYAISQGNTDKADSYQKILDKKLKEAGPYYRYSGPGSTARRDAGYSEYKAIESQIKSLKEENDRLQNDLRDLRYSNKPEKANRISNKMEKNHVKMGGLYERLRSLPPESK